MDGGIRSMAVQEPRTLRLAQALEDPNVVRLGVNAPPGAAEGRIVRKRDRTVAGTPIEQAWSGDMTLADKNSNSRGHSASIDKRASRRQTPQAHADYAA